MPLYKRKPFQLVEPPQELEPTELVFQVRFTKEIFRDYQEYLNHINLYRQRVWTCKFSGKTNLTYEEALVSESRATEKVQQFPKVLMGPVLHMIQFSTLTLKDLVTTVNKHIQQRLFEGLELFGRKDKSIFLCKILKILEDDDKIHYEVCWMDNYKNVTGSSVVSAGDLIRKKLPFGREVLKSFIRESTSRSTPWVVHDELAKRHGVRTSPPQDLVDKFSNCRKNILKRKKQETDNSQSLTRTKKAKKDDDEPIKYPIDDLLVQPGADDPIFTDRPPPSRDFGVPMNCVGDLLMVWDFCSTFGRLLNLWPFSFEDFENAICHKDTNLILIVESHSAILRLLIKDEGEYFTALQKKKRKSKITLVTWTEYLCDFLEMEDIPEFSTCIATVRRGHYGLLDPHAKLGILRELVSKALTTNVVREQLDEFIEQRQALGARKRSVAIEEARKRREEKLLKKSDSKDVIDRQSLENGGQNLNIYENGSIKKQNGSVTKARDKGILQYKRKKVSGSRDDKDVNSASGTVKQKIEVKVTRGKEKEASCDEEEKDAARQRNGKENEVQKEKTEEQTKEVLEREMEKHLIRTNSMGKDKNYNRYWFFQRDGRIFVESSDSKLWGYHSTKEELDALIGSLNLKGERERALYRQLQKYYDRICLALQKRSKDIATKIEMEEAVVRRSTRVRAPQKDSPVTAFLRYVNKWKED